MTESVVLCANEESLKNPVLIGLEDEALDAQPWLSVYTCAQATREATGANKEITEAWICSCDDVEPINLAATLKSDRPDLSVGILACHESGSFKSRAYAASIDVVFEQDLFAKRYAEMKQSLMGIRTQHEKSQTTHAALYDAQSGIKQQLCPTSKTNVSQKPVPPNASQSHLSLTDSSQTANLPTASPSGSLRPSSSISSSLALTSPLNTPAQSATTKSTTNNSSPLLFQQHSPHFGQRAFFMPVVSGSGGAGKSTIAALSALSTQQSGLKTALLDFDLQFGNMQEMLGQETALSIDEVLSNPALVNRLQPHENIPALLAPPRHLEHSEAIGQEVERLLDELSICFDVIVINTGAAWADHHIMLLERASKALFVVDQHASSLTACKHALELCARCGIAARPFTFVVNRCARGALFTSIDVSCALQGAQAVELKDGGRSVEEYLGAGLAADLIATDNDLCSSLEAMLALLLPDYAQHTKDTEAEKKKPKRGQPKRKTLWSPFKKRSVA